MNAVNFWWATQNRNYDTVIRLGTLWTCERAGRTTEEGRRLIKSIRPGDIVFHHARGYLRAVSRATTSWEPYPRPEGYPKPDPDEGDEGWLVRVEPIRTDLSLHFRRVAQLIRLGPGAPLDETGRTQQKYLSALFEEDGRALLEELGLDLALPGEDGLFGRPDAYWEGGDTDKTSLAEVRLEQADLRRHLLQGRATATCAVCGEERPARLLVAGHIKPRSACTEQERKDFRSVAMLVCSLGCDALFGWGYIVVDADGLVRRGVPAETKDVEAAVDLLVGKACGAHDERTAPSFAANAALCLGSA